MSTDPTLTLTIRFVRSFTHRNIKNLVVKISDNSIKVNDFKTFVTQGRWILF